MNGYSDYYQQQQQQQHSNDQVINKSKPTADSDYVQNVVVQRGLHISSFTFVSVFFIFTSLQTVLVLGRR